MDESISRAAGTTHGQEFAPYKMEETIRDADRIPRQRTTLYGTPPHVQQQRSYQAPPLAEKIQTAAAKYARVGSLKARLETIAAEN